MIIEAIVDRLRDIGRSMSRVLKGGNVCESKEKISLLM
jgi:hypothetical protein